MTAWRVVDLSDFSGPLRISRGQMVADSTTIPMAECAIILTGAGTQWSGELVALAARHDVAIIATDWRGLPIAATLPWSSNSRIAARHHAQADLSLPRKKNAWMRIVRAKIRGQANALAAYDPEGASRIAALVPRVRSGDIENVEARAARMFWSRYAPGESFRRDRDAVDRNAALNYGYTVVRSTMVRAICLAGMSPTFGIAHVNRTNPFGLADDLMEPFRPAVDHLVSQLPRDASLDNPQIKHDIVAVLSTSFEGRGRTVMTAITELAQRYATYVEGQVDTLSVDAWARADG